MPTIENPRAAQGIANIMSATELAIIYRRVSTDHQDNSMQLQEYLNTEYCKRLGLPSLDRAYEDPDVSGSIWFNERPGGNALLARLQFGDIKHLITAKQDRLGRDTLDTIATIRKIWELGITPHFTSEGGAFPRTPQNELLFEIKASVAQYERNLIRDRTRAVMQRKFSLHQLTGNVPYGHDCLYTFADGETLTSARALAGVRLRLARSAVGGEGRRAVRLPPRPGRHPVGLPITWPPSASKGDTPKCWSVTI